jgi:hypothetical protein
VRQPVAECAQDAGLAYPSREPDARRQPGGREYTAPHERALFDGALDPDGGTMTPDPDQPGLGLTLRKPDAERYRRS